LFVLIINHQQIQWEELALEQRFEQEYLDYKTRVRRWL
jgi:protein-S-isoprenylcysteine O-methyltransferase Ste14